MPRLRKLTSQWQVLLLILTCAFVRSPALALEPFSDAQPSDLNVSTCSKSASTNRVDRELRKLCLQISITANITPRINVQPGENWLRLASTPPTPAPRAHTHADTRTPTHARRHAHADTRHLPSMHRFLAWPGQGGAEFGPLRFVIQKRASLITWIPPRTHTLYQLCSSSRTPTSWM